MIERVEHVDSELNGSRFGNPKALAERKIGGPVAGSPQACLAYVTGTYRLATGSGRAAPVENTALLRYRPSIVAG